MNKKLIITKIVLLVSMFIILLLCIPEFSAGLNVDKNNWKHREGSSEDKTGSPFTEELTFNRLDNGGTFSFSVQPRDYYVLASELLSVSSIEDFDESYSNEWTVGSPVMASGVDYLYGNLDVAPRNGYDWSGYMGINDGIFIVGGGRSGR